MADDAGALLVRAGLVSASSLSHARERVAQVGGTLGEALVTDGALDDDALTTFFQQRLLVPKANPALLARLPAEVIRLVPPDRAAALRLVPVSRDRDNNLTVAMSDPSNRHAVDEIGTLTGAYVLRAVATQMQIAWCLAHYYGHVTALAERLLQPDPATGLPPRISRTPTPPPRPRSVTDQVHEARHRRVLHGVPASGTTPTVAAAQPTQQAAVQPMQQAAVQPTQQAAAQPTQQAAVQPTPGPAAQPTPGSAAQPTPEPAAPPTQQAAAQPTPGPAVQPTQQAAARPTSATGSAPEPHEVVITIEADAHDTEPQDEPPAVFPPTGQVTRRTSSVPRRKKPARPDPPELAARAGEVQLASGAQIRAIDFGQPSILISDELTRALHTGVAGELQARAQRERTITPPAIEIQRELLGEDEAAVAAAVTDERSEPVVLERRRVSAPPPTFSEASAPGEVDEEPEEVIVLERPKPPRRSGRITAVGVGALTASAPAHDRRSDTPDASDATAAGARPPGALEALDDGWGPPGATLPPSLLGAIPGANDAASGAFPLPDLGTAPLIVAPPTPPTENERPGSPGDTTVAHALEHATTSVLDLIHTLDHTSERDQVLAVMIAHLADSHQRAGFFVVRGSELALFAISPRIEAMPTAALRLDRASTLADVVDTRLPYRGPMLDDTSREFLDVALGGCPTELLLVPVAVRGRVVGVLFGDRRTRHTFDEQLALAARAAGMALERILRSRRG